MERSYHRWTTQWQQRQSPVGYLCIFSARSHRYYKSPVSTNIRVYHLLSLHADFSSEMYFNISLTLNTHGKKSCHAAVCACMCESDKYLMSENPGRMLSSSRTHLQQHLALFQRAYQSVNYFPKYLECFVSRQPGGGKLQRSGRLTTLSTLQELGETWVLRMRATKREDEGESGGEVVKQRHRQ